MTSMPRANDRRQGVRFEIVGSLRGRAVLDQHVRMHNFSAGGALVESHWPLPAAARVFLKQASGGLETAVESRVRHTRRVSEVHYLVGLQFMAPASSHGSSRARKEG